MTASNHPGVEETLRLIEDLRTTIREFAKREEELSAGIRQETAKQRKEREGFEAERMSAHAAEREAAEAARRVALASAETRYETRKVTISAAGRRGKEQVLERVDSKMGFRKYELQKNMLLAEKEREAGLAKATKDFEEYRQRLTKMNEAEGELEIQARAALRNYSGFVRRLGGAESIAKPDLSADENRLFTDLEQNLEKIRDGLKELRRHVLHQIAGMLPSWLTTSLAAVLCAGAYFYPQFDLAQRRLAMEVIGGGWLVLIGLHVAGRRQVAPIAARIIEAMGSSRLLLDACWEKSEKTRVDTMAQARAAFARKTQDIDEGLQRAVSEASQQRVSTRVEMDEKTVRVAARNEKHYRTVLARLTRIHRDIMERVERENDLKRLHFEQATARRESAFNISNEAKWEELTQAWKAKVEPLYAAIEQANASANRMFPDWQSEAWAKWNPPTEFAHEAKFGEMEVDLATLCELIPQDSRLALPGPSAVRLPLFLTYPDHGSLVFEMNNSGREEMVGAINNLILRLLSVSPPGKLSFTIIDPIALGQNFAGVMHLAEYDEQLINSRIRTQSGPIEQRLQDLNEHMEKVIQMYLRNDYETVTEYNKQAGNLAEKYHFVIIADFPANFTEAAAKRLLSIAASGARCGVFMFILWDHKQPLPQDFIPSELRKNSVSITCKGGEFALTGKFLPGTRLTLDAPPPPAMASEFIHKAGRSSHDAGRVEVPFDQVTPAKEEEWTLDTTSELRVPIGRTGATKLQYLAIGKGTRQHALIAGKTGSGKSTLFHVVITNLALWCSPEQVEFYLVDFKKGVEFKCYATHRLPHARVIAIESDREFGLSVLERVDEELKRRGDLFRQYGAQDLAGFKKAGGGALPRTLLLIDEFQEFFTEEDKISQGASVLLDRIVRQGRAFGIHVILGSQTLGGAYTLARTTIGQMVIRVALQCNEADSYLIMDDSNSAPRLLSRPGEGIYNDTSGTVDGNSPFQTVWLPEEVRDECLETVRHKADASPAPHPGTIIFEGNAPAAIEENIPLRDLLAAESVDTPVAPRVWLGAPNAIKGPTEAALQRQSGNNLLVAGQRDEAMLAMLAISMISLAAQFPRDGARFVLVDSTPPGVPQREFLDQTLRAIPHTVTVARNHDLAEVFKQLSEEMRQRAADDHPADKPAIFVLIHGAQKFSKLRQEDEYNFASDGAEETPAVMLNNLVTGGPSVGIHLIVMCDTFNNVNRFLSRKAVSEIEMRVLFQMSASDSSSLVDSPKANSLGLHRALFYNEQEGSEELFRPYALPETAWLERAGKQLQGRRN